MQIVTKNAELRLLELVKALRGDPSENYALYFALSLLQEENRSEFQLKIVLNVLNDIFRGAEGTILLCQNGDVFLIYHGSDRILLEKAVFQLRYLFVDDPVATNPDGSENEQFASMWDLGFQWRPFHNLCVQRIEMMNRQEQGPARAAAAEKSIVPNILTPEGLVEVMEKLEGVDLSNALRSQPVCAKRRGMDIKMVFKEMYVNITHLTSMLGVTYNLLSDKSLFKHLTVHLDRFVLETLRRDRGLLASPISLNLNVETVLSDNFKIFSDMIQPSARSIVLEIHVADVFSDMHAFKVARDNAHRLGYRICLDGLTNMSFVQVSRESLGFDLAKLQWNADMEGDLGTPENIRLAGAINTCGSNRMILCRCDSHHAIDYGHALGISLFQGRYPDRILNPDATVIN